MNEQPTNRSQMDKLVRLSDVLEALLSYGIGWGDAKVKGVLNSIPAVDAVEVDGATKQAIELIVDERRRQIAEWGNQSAIPLFEFMSILGEEFGELCQAVNETLFANPKHPERGGREAIIREAVQVAAVAAQIIEEVLADGQRKEEGERAVIPVHCEGCKHWKDCHGYCFNAFEICYEPEEDGDP